MHKVISFRHTSERRINQVKTPRVHIIGRKNSGKTMLIAELSRQFSSEGQSVATIKHTSHHHDIDTPGKDSFKHERAGAHAVGILSPGTDAMFFPVRDDRRKPDRYEVFESAFADFDLILVEGDSCTQAPKIEVWREACGQEPIAYSDPAILAVVSDDGMTDSDGLPPQWSRGDVPFLASQLRQIAQGAQLG